MIPWRAWRTPTFRCQLPPRYRQPISEDPPILATSPTDPTHKNPSIKDHRGDLTRSGIAVAFNSWVIQCPANRKSPKSESSVSAWFLASRQAALLRAPRIAQIRRRAFFCWKSENDEMLKVPAKITPVEILRPRLRPHQLQLDNRSVVSRLLAPPFRRRKTDVEPASGNEPIRSPISS